MTKVSTYDYAIVGGGIAGLAIAEIFARSGHSVVLIERNAQLCQEASASHHGWFHFGSLYSIFPQNQFLRTMVSGAEDLLEHYNEFPGMNINIGDTGRLSFPQGEGAWFRDQPIEYIVSARNNPDFDMRAFAGFPHYARKVFFLLTWEAAIKQFVSRHQRFHQHNWAGNTPASDWIPRAGWADYSRDVITKPDNPDINLDKDTHFQIVGYDRPMRADRIIGDLLRSLLGAGGTVRTSSEVEYIEKSCNAKVVHLSNGEAIKSQNVILASGKWTGELVPKANEINVMASPIVVAYPAVSTSNFVRMTPFVEKSINHLHHEIDGHCYSVIGGGYFADPNNMEHVEQTKDNLMAMAKGVFPALNDSMLLEAYLGYKTEIVSRPGERNYQYTIREVDDGIHAVIPGKFSLSFSLAVQALKKLTGHSPGEKIRLAPIGTTRGLVGVSRHAKIVRDMLGQRNGQVARQ